MKFFSFFQKGKDSAKEAVKVAQKNESKGEGKGSVTTIKDPLDYIIKSYGDLVFDLCDSLLVNPQSAHIAFRSILKKTRISRKSPRYAEYERSWVLKIACKELVKFYESYGPRVSLQEQIKLSDHTNISAKLKQFATYFRRLTSEDQILLILKDKYDIPYEDISSALDIPEGSLKVRRQQALRTLEEWLWNSR